MEPPAKADAPASLRRDLIVAAAVGALYFLFAHTSLLLRSDTLFSVLLGILFWGERLGRRGCAPAKEPPRDRTE